MTKSSVAVTSVVSFSCEGGYVVWLVRPFRWIEPGQTFTTLDTTFFDLSVTITQLVMETFEPSGLDYGIKFPTGDNIDMFRNYDMIDT